MGNTTSRVEAAAKRASRQKLTDLITPVPADIDVAQAAKTLPIKVIAASCGLSESDYEPYGHYKAKVSACVCANHIASRRSCAKYRS